MATRVLIDDLRHFDNPMPGDIILRTSTDALEWLRSNTEPVSELWLDHDLGGDDTIGVVIDELSFQAFTNSLATELYGLIIVHTSNPAGAAMMLTALNRWGYKVLRVNASNYFFC